MLKTHVFSTIQWFDALELSFVLESSFCLGQFVENR